MKPGYHYECTRCGRSFHRNEVTYLCPDCSSHWSPGRPLEGVLQAVFDYETLKKEVGGMHPDLGVINAVEKSFVPPIPVGHTPLFPCTRISEKFAAGADIWIKNDSLNPSGSLKDRASLAVAAEALRNGDGVIVAASTGNAASSTAAICAAAGLEAVIFAPATAPRAKLVQIMVHGARLVLVEGTYDQAFELSLEYTARFGGLNRNTAYHPMTIEGKKTVALELFAQLGRMPDTVVVPVGDGVILASVHKGFKDIVELGLARTVPRLVAVQAESSDAVHHLFTKGEFRPAHPCTVADSIAVSAPSNAWLAVKALKESKGVSVTVSDEEILAAQRDLAVLSGVFAEPAAAATLAGLAKLAETDSIAPGETVVLLVTGHGLKDIDSAAEGLELPNPIPPDPDILEGLR